MTYLFAREAAPTLARFLSSEVLLAFDFDGTLAPIVTDRRQARMRRRTHRLLEALCPLYPCAVISGRRRDDVLRRLEGLPIRHVIGNHGVDIEGARTDIAAEMAGLRDRVAAALEGPGIEIEDKTHSLSIHYRQARERPRTRERIERALSGLDRRFRVVPGKAVYDIVSARAPHKGDALTLLHDAERVDATIYFGDDATDEDIFRGADPHRLLPIRVGRSRRSAAPYYVRDQRELDAFLAYAVRLRARPHSNGTTR